MKDKAKDERKDVANLSSVVCASKLCRLHSLLNPALVGVRYYIISAIARNEAEKNECRRCLEI